MRNPCALLILCVVAACTSRGSEAAERPADTVARRDSIAGVAAATMGEHQVLGLLEQTHAADSAFGVLASTKASATELRDFGRMIVREHHALRMEVQSLAQDLRLTPEAPSVAPDAPPEEMLAQLEAGAPGAAWDLAYLHYGIALHRSALENSARALAATRSPETRRFIERSVPILQKHFDKASSLGKALGHVSSDSVRAR